MSLAEIVRPIVILLVEDNPGDVRLIREAMRERRMQVDLHAVENGVEALAFLRRENGYARVPRPDLILLDLNLPKMDGRGVLTEVKEDRDLRRIPVVVLTASQAEEDIFRAYDLRANCYVTKPLDLDQFMDAVQTIQNFWMSVVKLPVD